MGPQHPSTHGVFRMVVTLSGETVVDVMPVMGYLHRGVEKLAEETTYQQGVTFTDRMDYLSPMTGNFPFVLAVEKLAGIQVPERAEYLRVIAAELQRISSHLAAIGFLGNDLGTWFTPLTYCMRERELILDLFEMLCGARITPTYMRPGGVSQDLPDGFVERCRRFLDNDMPRILREIPAMLTNNEIVQHRLKGVGILPAERAIAYSMSGPNLRGSGVKHDVRKAAPYSVYDRFEFDIPTGTIGDCWDRYNLRYEEIIQSMRIIRQALEQLPPGPVMAQLPRPLRAPAGAEAFARTEASKGELGVYMASDGGIAPYRCKLRAPSFINLTALREMLMGAKVADVVVILGTLDIVLGEVDR
ncbi:MAG: NADH-quinone oxidoreductase subunit D [Bacteroidetes bacterium]|nr:NADH-quinone oxidoreductase subunit D [Bacteroidota bacterium]